MMGRDLERALKRLEQSVQRADASPEARAGGEVRETVLAVLDAGLHDSWPQATDLAQLGSMLFVPHPGAPERSWLAIAKALQRMATALGLDSKT